MSDLTDFLLARVAEDEAVARCAEPMFCDFTMEGQSAERFGGHLRRFDPARVLAECETKRRIIERHQLVSVVGDLRPSDSGTLHILTGVLRELALPYADHPDYQQEWKP